ncbi:da148293-8f97-42f1-93ff-fcc8079fafbe [Thermothielavioides terrestris]|uniref:Da148293-8f97-42f1-93ff-fcc8079fafbe n=1 Tax=Thermothielavioides terrestris TaxID=2587410 RepID=A0A3S5CX79_9PEZI|nr:da148293-8f97-42f1-93ff-fcc8079fafbe [Thermothielavioides terrestris]
MEVALTFGSLGDIIAICQLCVQLSRALGLGRKAVGGSALEYQELRKDLNLFIQVLLQVVATYEAREPSAYLAGLDQATKAVVDECAGLIEQAIQHFGSRYHDSLRAEGSGNKWRDACKKVEWAVREKERLLELREKLRRNTERLTLLNGLVMRKSARVDNATMLARIDEVQRLVSAEASGREEMLRLLKEQHAMADMQAHGLQAVNDQLSAVKQSLSAIAEMKDTLSQIAQVAAGLQVTASASTFLRFIDPTRELPVILVDFLGQE